MAAESMGARRRLRDHNPRDDLTFLHFASRGHSNIAVLTAMANNSIKFVNTRHEQIAAHIADGYARTRAAKTR